MPSIKSARASERHQLRNQSIRSAIKTDITKARKLISAGELDSAQKAVKAAIVALDKASQKGVIHPNNAARHTSRLVGKLNQALAQKTKSG